MTTSQNTVRIGADVGGTFTDVILIDAENNIWRHKVPSTPPNFEGAVLSAIGHLLHTARVSGVAVTETVSASALVWPVMSNVSVPVRPSDSAF